MPTTALMPVPKQQYFANAGIPLIGGKVYTYAAGTNTPKSTFTDSAGTIPQPNPIILNSRGEPPNAIYWSGNYKVVIQDAFSNTIYTVDNYNTDPAGVWNILSTLASSIGSTLIGFIQAGAGAVLRTVQDRLRETVSVRDFGVIGNGSDEYLKIKKAWDYCVANRKNLHFPGGYTYSSGANNMPFKNPAFPASSLLDCGNITISGDGPSTILKSVSATGADVVNCYSVKNLHFRDFSVMADLTGTSGSGSNALSVVGGFDNVTFENIHCLNLPYVDKVSYLDGGKALSIQPGAPAEECGTLKATRIFSTGCVYGVGLEVDLVNWGGKKHAIDVDVVAEDCYIGVLFSAGAASGPLSEAMTMGYRVRAQLVNCQRNVYVGRGHGVDIDANIITTKSAADRRLNPNGGTWNSVDSIVDSLNCTYAKDSRILVYGDIGECDYKFQIGGALEGASGLVGSTEACDFYFDLGGTAGIADFNLVNAGGNTMSNCRAYISSTTLTSIPTAAYAPSLSNTLIIGPTQRIVSPIVSNSLSFSYTDGISIFHTIKRNNNSLEFNSSASSSASNVNFRFNNHTGAMIFGIRNDGFLMVDGRATASSVGSLIQVIPIYDSSNVIVGYVPIYQTFS